MPGLLSAFRFHDDGTADSLPIDQPIELVHDGWLWLHLNLADARACRWLNGAELPAPAVATMLSRDRHQQLHSLGSCIYGIFADLVREFDGTRQEIGLLRFIMTGRMLISGRHHALTAVEAARTAIQSGARRLPHVAGLLELIVEHVADGIDGVVEDLVTDLDQIEDCLARGTNDFDQQALTSVRRTCVRLHRVLFGLRTVFHRLERQGFAGIDPSLRLSAGQLAHRLDTLDHDVIELRDRGHRMQEQVSTMIAEETNRHLKLLSILTALFLPPTLVSGMFGMNLKGLPFAEADNGFIPALLLILFSSAVVYLIMRRFGVTKL